MRDPACRDRIDQNERGSAGELDRGGLREPPAARRHDRIGATIAVAASPTGLRLSGSAPSLVVDDTVRYVSLVHPGLSGRMIG